MVRLIKSRFGLVDRRAPIHRPACLSVLGAYRPVFPITHDIQLVGRVPQHSQVILSLLGPRDAQRQIDFFPSALVAVPFNYQLEVGLLQNDFTVGFSILLLSGLRVLSGIVLVCL